MASRSPKRLSCTIDRKKPPCTSTAATKAIARARGLFPKAYSRSMVIGGANDSIGCVRAAIARKQGLPCSRATVMTNAVARRVGDASNGSAPAGTTTLRWTACDAPRAAHTHLLARQGTMRLGLQGGATDPGREAAGAAPGRSCSNDRAVDRSNRYDCRVTRIAFDPDKPAGIQPGGSRSRNWAQRSIPLNDGSAGNASGCRMSPWASLPR